MITSFSTKWPWGALTNFEHLVPVGLKPHTIRRHRRGNSQRKPGQSLHFWSGSPRNPSKNTKPLDCEIGVPCYWRYVNKPATMVLDAELDVNRMPNYRPGNPDMPGLVSHLDAVPVLFALEEIEVVPDTFKVYVGGRSLNHGDIVQLSRFDGFRTTQLFFDYFTPDPEENGIWTGELLHWTDGCLYTPDTARVLTRSPKQRQTRQLRLELGRIEREIASTKEQVVIPTRHQLRNRKRLEVLLDLQTQARERLQPDA